MRVAFLYSIVGILECNRDKMLIKYLWSRVVLQFFFIFIVLRANDHRTPTTLTTFNCKSVITPTRVRQEFRYGAVMAIFQHAGIIVP